MVRGSPRAAARLVRGLLPVGVGVALLAACASSDGSGRGEWDLVAVDGEVLSLSVVIGSSSCNDLGDVEVDETASRVTVEVEVTVGSGDCTADLERRTTEVRLAAPLGDRVLEGCRPRNPVAEGGFDEEGNVDCAAVTPIGATATTMPPRELHPPSSASEAESRAAGDRFVPAWAA